MTDAPEAHPPAAPNAPDLDALEGPDKARTPGPWKYISARPGYITTIESLHLPAGASGVAYTVNEAAGIDQQNIDAEFIAALANAAPWLIAQARRCAALEEALEPFAKLARWALEHDLPASILRDDSTPVFGHADASGETQEAYVTVGHLRHLVDLTGAQPSRIAALEAENARLRGDGDRMNWLACHTVNVRIPLPYGSRDLFWASPDEECNASDLREQIDEALRIERAALSPAPAPASAGGETTETTHGG